MSNREGKVFCHTEADDRIAWEATSHTLPGDRLFPWEELPRNCSSIIMSNREGKVFCHTEADDRIAWEATSHTFPGDRLFPWEELPRNCSRIDVLEWYIDIANEKNLSLKNITLFPMAVDHGSLTVCTSVCNMWYSYIDRLKAESNKGKKRVNPITARCLFIIHCLITNYLNDVKIVGSHATQPSKRARKDPPSLLPKSVFIELSINGSSEEMQSYTSSIKQLPEFERCTYNKNGEVIVNLQSVFDGADNFRMNTRSGRYGAAYNMVGLRCFNEELSLLPKNPTEAKLQATSTRGESTEPT
jgi:hypothetical protein